MEAIYDVPDTTPPTPHDPFLTPAHSPVPSAPGSTHNLALAQLAGATASRLSINSPSYSFASLANGQGPLVGAVGRKGTEGMSLSRVSTAPGTLNGTFVAPAVPPLPHLHSRTSRAAGSVDLASSSVGGGIHHGKRESFAAPPKMVRPPSASSYGASRRLSQRPGTAGTLGSVAHLTPPSTASAASLSEKNAWGVAFQINEERKSYPSKRMECKMLEPGTVVEKPWLEKPSGRARASYWLTALLSTLGIAASFLRIWYGAKDVQLLKGNLCPVLEDDFDGDSIDTSKWSWDVAMDGFG